MGQKEQLNCLFKTANGNVYQSACMAEKIVKKMLKKGRQVHKYLCSNCGKWHIGGIDKYAEKLKRRKKSERL